MKKGIISWLLIIAMIVTQAMVPAFGSAAYALEDEPVLTSLGTSTWTGNYPVPGDSVFYVEAQGLNLDNLETEVLLYEYPSTYTPAASQTRRWYLGTTQSGDDRYIYEMTVDGGVALASDTQYYIRIKDDNGNYYDNGDIPLNCFSPYLYLETGNMPQEIGTHISSLPLDMTMDGADGNVNKDNISIKLYTGTKNGYWGEMDLGHLVGTLDNPEIIITGMGQHRIKGDFSIDGLLSSGDKLYIEAEYRGYKAYTGSPIYVLAPEDIGRFAMTNSIAAKGTEWSHGGGGYEAAGDSTYIVGMPVTGSSVTAHRFTITSGNLSSAAQLSASDDNGNSLLRNGSAAVSGPEYGIYTVSGMLDVPTEAEEIIFKYGGSAVHSVPVSRTAIQGSISLTPLNAEYKQMRYIYPENTHSFKASLSGLNLPSSPGRYSALIDDNVVGCSIDSTDGEIIFNITSTEPLNNEDTAEHFISILMDGTELINLTYDEYNGLQHYGSTCGAPLTFGDFWYTAGLTDVVPPALTRIYGSRGLTLFGEGFSSGKTYTAHFMEHTAGGLSAAPQELTAAFVSSGKLDISKENTDNLARGRYEVFITENGQQLNGFAEAVLLPAEDVEQIINPAVSINDGEAYTLNQEVSISIDPGSFTKVRFSEYQEELGSLSYTSILSPVSYTLSDGYGNKTIYFEFSDAKGRTYNTTASINYRSQLIPAPALYGIAGITDNELIRLYKYADYTLYIQTEESGYVCKADFVDGFDNILSSFTLSRTSSKDGTDTYSKRINVGNEYIAAAKLRFYFTDTYGLDSEYAQIPVSVLEQPYITSTRTDISTGYSFSGYYAVYGSDMKMSIEGKAGLNAAAVLKYKDGAGNEKDLQINLTAETEKPKSYKADCQLPADAAELISVTYRLTDPSDSGSYAEKSESRELKVFASASFEGLPNLGEFDGKYLKVTNVNGISDTIAIKDEADSFTFNRLLPGNYTYSLFDNEYSFRRGEFTAAPGSAASIDLSDTKKPASISFNVDVENDGTLSENAYVKFKCASSGGTYYRYAGLNEKVSGFTEEMTVEEYTLILPDSDLRVYESPDTITSPVILTEGVNNISISVSKMETVTVQITIKDENIPGRTIPGASVSAGQLITNGPSWFYHTASGITDNSGKVELTLYPALSASIESSKENYNTSREYFSVGEESNQSFDMSLSYADQNKLIIKTMALPLVPAGESADISQASESQNILTGILTTDEDGNRLNRYFYYNTASFTDTMYNKTVRVHPYLDRAYISAEEYYTAVLDEYGNGTLVITAVPKGIITADIDGRRDGVSSYMALYNESGRMIASVNDADGRLSTATCNLDEGSYTAVVFSGYNLPDLNTFYSIDNFDNLGMTENTHYVKRNADVTNGKITDLGEINIPEPITKDMLLPYTVTFDSRFEPLTADGSIGKIHIKYKISISELLKNSIKLKNVRPSTHSGTTLLNKKINGLDSEFGQLDYTPDSEGNYTITFSSDTAAEQLKNYVYIYLTFEQDGRDISAGFNNIADTPQVSLIAPRHVSKTVNEITVRGAAFSGSSIEIYDGETLIGSADANWQHSYSATVTLVSSKTASVHTLTAKMTTPDDRVFTSEPVTCEVIDDDKRASVSSFEFRNVAHYGSLDAPDIETYNIDVLGSGSFSGAYRYNPSLKSRVTFRINKLVSAQLENVYVINTAKNGTKTRYPASLVMDDPQGRYSEWIMEEVLGSSINDLSVFYSLKDGEDMGLLTGYLPPTEQQFNDSLNNLGNIEPANLPAEYRSNEAAVITAQTENSVKAHKDFGGVRVGIEANYNDVSGYTEASLLSQGFRKIPVGSSGEFYLIKDSSTETANEFRVYRTMYVSSGLAASMKEGTSYVSNEGVIKSEGTLYAGTSPVLYASTSDTVRNISGKVDYAGYVQNTGEIAYEAFRNRTANLGHLGTGMQVIGGVATAVQIFSGPASIDPANLRTLTDQIKDASVRSRLNDEITEYRKARTDSHSISSLMGVVSYGSSFFSLPGKCLSYVVSTGNMVFTQKIDAEYNIWGNGILSQITMQLRKEGKDIGEEDDTDDPKWLMDPSGYVFEAVESNRIEGVTATVQTDSYGEWAAWEDEFLIESEQENPQTTDEYGKYGWDVPEGSWRVMFEDSDRKYNAALTKSMTVPPVHTEVNIGLVSTEAPQVRGTAADSSGIEIEFSMYMQSESVYDPEEMVNAVQVIETSTGEIVPCRGVDLIAESENTGYTSDDIYQDDVISSEKFVKRIRFNADEELYPGGFKLYEDDGETPKEYTVSVSENVLSYSGVKMDEDFSAVVTASERMTASEPVSDTEGGSYDEAIEVRLSTSTSDADIYYTTDGSEPTANSFRYTKPIKISESCHLKAFASMVGMNDSSEFYALYIIGDEEIPVPPKPDDGDGDNNNHHNNNGSTPPAEIPVVPAAEETINFNDVFESDWFYENVKFVVNKGLFKGMTENLFQPYGKMTRAMLVTVLFRLDGAVNAGKPKFTDIQENLWYTDAVGWASQNGVVGGYGTGLFGPDDNITREQLCTILYRYAQMKKYDVSNLTDIESFNDYKNVSDWALVPIKWMVSNKLLNGKTGNILDPSGYATRAEVAAILQRFIEYINR